MATPTADSDPVLNTALAYAAHGLHVLPIQPGHKHPPMQEWQNAGTTDPAIIHSWWNGLYRGHGIGILTGSSSRVWVLDIDTTAGKVGAESLAELEASYSPLPSTVEAITGSGGRHLFFAWDPEHPVRNNQSGKAGKDVDIRGEGGQVVAAPTIHPDTRRPYQWRPGHGPGEIPFAEAPGWLYAILEREPDPPPRPPRPATRLTVVGDPDEDSAAAAFNASTTWDQLLTRDGWKLDRTLSSGEQRWTRPGKGSGTSATVGHKGRDILKVFTSSVPALIADQAYRRFGYEAAVNWSDNRSAFARHLRQQMNEANRTERLDLTNLTGLLAAPAAAYTDPEEAANESETTDEWPTPEPLDPELVAGPPFPVDVLPDWIAEAALSCADGLQAPVDLPASLALGGLSAITMGKVQIQVDLDDDDPWIEGTNLYLVTALPPGAAKSPAFKAMLGCIRKLERELVDDRATVIREAEITKEILTKRAKAARDTAALPGSGAEEAREAGRLQAEADSVVIPPTPRMIADDATPEALIKLLSRCGERIALMSSEGGLFDMMAGQYTDRGKTASLDIYLKGWSGDSINSDRAGADKEPIALEQPLLTVCVTPQPILIKRLGENAELAGRGVSARFVYSVPRSNIGGRDRRARRRRNNRGARSRYEDQMLALGRRLAAWAYPATLRLSDDAADAFEDWDQDHEERLAPGRDLAHMAEWMMKLRAYVLRSAALLHIADGRDIHEPVDVETLGRAFRLGDYWIEHARCVHASWGAAVNLIARPARKLLRWAVDERLESFTQRQAYLKLRSNDNTVKVGDVVDVLGQLIEMGWLRADGEFPGHRGKTATLLVHPQAEQFLSAHDAQHAHDAQPEVIERESEASDDEPARHARCAYSAERRTHTPLDPFSSSEPLSASLRANAHDAQDERAVDNTAEPSGQPHVVADATGTTAVAEDVIDLTEQEPSDSAAPEATTPAPSSAPADDDPDWSLW